MSTWMLYWGYYGEGGGGVLPIALNDREKTIVEKIIEIGLIDSCKKIEFVELELCEGEKPC